VAGMELIMHFSKEKRNDVHDISKNSTVKIPKHSLLQENYQKLLNLNFPVLKIYPKLTVTQATFIQDKQLNHKNMSFMPFYSALFPNSLHSTLENEDVATVIKPSSPPVTKGRRIELERLQSYIPRELSCLTYLVVSWKTSVPLAEMSLFDQN
jgi:hypothetical protein